MKIYTKTGDSGETGMIGGVRVPKFHPGIEVCGSLDELNSVIGKARTHEMSEELGAQLERFQSELFDIGSCVAASLSDSARSVSIIKTRPEELEKTIDAFQAKLTELKAFVLPGGSPLACDLHLARSVCRRAERRLVELMSHELKRDLSTELIYLNRLGDLLFVLARTANKFAGVEEPLWQPQLEPKNE